MKTVLFSKTLESAFTVSLQGILYSTPLLPNGAYNQEKWAKVCMINEVNVLELESIVVRLVSESLMKFEKSKNDIINEILHKQVEVINY